MAAPDLLSILFAPPARGNDDGSRDHASSRLHRPTGQTHAAPVADDAALLAAIRAGDAIAFETVFRRYYPALRDFARRLLRTEGDAADIVEDVFARLWERRAAMTIDSSLTAYLYATVRHRAVDVLRQERNRRLLRTRFQSDVSNEHAMDATVEDDVPDTDTVIHRINAAIAALPERRRLVLTLRWEGGLGNAEIATVLGIAPQSVANLVQRALTDLRAALPHDLR